MHPIIALLLGLTCAGLGGELFVRGVVGLARWARVPAGIVGATIAAFATSSPEFTVAVNSARAGIPQVAVGDALGSNVVNVGLILGLALLFGPMKATEGSLRRDLPVALLAPVALGLLLIDGTLSRLDGAILLTLFAVWLGFTIVEAKNVRDTTMEVLEERSRRASMGFCIAGLTLLVVAGGLIVDGAKFIGNALGWSSFVVGATLVAVGTSMPELATTIISRIRRHDEVGLGTVIGSNVFNGLFVVGVAAVIRPIPISLNEVLVGLGFGTLAILVCMPGKEKSVARSKGPILLLLYAVYVAFLILGNPG